MAPVSAFEPGILDQLGLTEEEGLAMRRQARALADVHDERERQEEIGRAKRAEGVDWRSCADPAMAGGDDRRFTVLGEEFGEVARSLLETGYGGPEGGDAHLRSELVQVAAVAVAWIEAIDARRGA